MPLDKAALTRDLKTAFHDAKENSWSADQAAEAIAAAIDRYVTAAEVGGVSVNVVSNGLPVGSGSLFGNGTQIGTVKLQ